MKQIPKILLLFIIGLNFCYTQNWLKIDSIFNPYGVSVLNWSSPEFCDIDNDNDFDLFLGNGSSERLRFFTNVGTRTSPRFRQDTSLVSSIYAQGFMGTNSDYPVLCDIDGDYDFDLITGGFNGLLLYINIGSKSQPFWKKDTSVFSIINSQIGTDAKPAFADLDGDGDADLLIGIGESLFGGPTPGVTLGFRNIGTRTSPQFQSDNSLVTGIADVGLNSYPVLRDLDNDGRFDLLIGRDLTGLVYYRNTGSVQFPTWTYSTTPFSGIGATTYWNNPTLCDLDGDNDFDLIYGSSDGTLFYYTNNGTVTTPSFTYDASYFSVIRIDGNASTVSFADYDKDGDSDFISGDWLGRFQYFQNIGTTQQPIFKKTSMPFSSLDAGSYSSPVFVDIDNDGDYDITSGALDGKVYLYINNNGTFSQNTSMFASIDVGWRSLPAFVDIDADGDLDLCVGAEDAVAMQFFKNTGQNVFVADSSVLKDITSVRNGHPTFTDLDKDGDYDLVIGGISGNLLFYQNVGTKFSPQWERNDYPLSDVRVRQDAAPDLADLDGDKRVDIVVGEYNGNFTCFKNLLPTSVEPFHSTVIPTTTFVRNFPNPFNSYTTFSFQIQNEGIVELELFDVIGRKIETMIRQYFRAGKYSFVWTSGILPSGIYFYRFTSTASGTGKYQSHSEKILLIR